MKKMSSTKKILIILLLVFIVIQVIRPGKNEGQAMGTEDITSVVQVPDSIMVILKASCYDCHSDHSEYPWFDQVTPVNWWVNHHINEGKSELNFTHFGTYSAKKMHHKLDEIAETVEKGEMPLPSYLWMHGEAKLSPAQREAIINWAKSAQGSLQLQQP
ncbi:heme-binding domain-containing protein [Chitinophaga caeni]|nr:heme-binding domain-containing protein [Chitinophaga caeni]